MRYTVVCAKERLIHFRSSRFGFDNNAFDYSGRQWHSGRVSHLIYVHSKMFNASRKMMMFENKKETRRRRRRERGREQENKSHADKCVHLSRRLFSDGFHFLMLNFSMRNKAAASLTDETDICIFDAL